ncbi:MAG TPA: ATP-binding protein [Longimicrobium sp.]|nr:ATP-binding protein [Longimicrobium sp.]
MRTQTVSVDLAPVRTTPDAGTVRPFGALSGAAALGAAAVAVGVLADWAVEGRGMAALLPGRAVMLPVTALSVLVAAAALWLLRHRAPPRLREAGRALAALAVALGVASLALRIARVEVGGDLYLFREAVARRVPAGSRMMGINTSACLALAGLALLLAARETRRGWRASQALAAVGMLIAFLALIGHGYEVRSLYTAGSIAGGMALPTALAMAALHVGVFFARPSHGYAALVTGRDASGVLARQLLPPAVLIPVGLGWTWLHARRGSLLTREEAVSLFAILIVGAFVALVFRAAAEVRGVDREREASLVRAQKAREEAEEANRAKMDFLAVMSHELRTPLNAIGGYTELLEMGIHGPVTPEQREALGRVRRSQRHLLLLINDVLNFAKIEAGRVEIRPAEIAVAELVAGVEPLILPQSEARGLRYARHLPDAPLAVHADPDKAGQILLNLLSNAVKFTESGGEVAVECEGAKGRVLIRVRDTGAGIPPERLESIFEPFVQLERGLTAQREGTGLGLAISRDLARAMGGDLSATSAPGRGSTFTLVLPRVESA